MRATRSVLTLCLRHAKENNLREVVRARRRQLQAEQAGVEISQHGRSMPEVVLGQHPRWLLPQTEPVDDRIAGVFRTCELAAVADVALLKLVKSQGGFIALVNMVVFEHAFPSGSGWNAQNKGQILKRVLLSFFKSSGSLCTTCFFHWSSVNARKCSKLSALH